MLGGITESVGFTATNPVVRVFLCAVRHAALEVVRSASVMPQKKGILLGTYPCVMERGIPLGAEGGTGSQEIKILLSCVRGKKSAFMG
jgi:hypothetical protein